MLQRISKKIEHIQSQPEHVRLRWVWICVSISMFFILAIWIFSITTLFNGNNKELDGQEDAQSISEQLQDIKKTAPSLENFKEASPSASDEGISPSKQQIDSQYIPDSAETQTPQTDAYSDLKNQADSQ